MLVIFSAWDQNVETTFYYLMLTEEYLKPQKEREFISSRIIMMMIWALKSFFAFLPKIEWLRERRTQKLNGSVTTTLCSWKVYKWRWSLRKKKWKWWAEEHHCFFIIFYSFATIFSGKEGGLNIPGKESWLTYSWIVFGDVSKFVFSLADYWLFDFVTKC